MSPRRQRVEIVSQLVPILLKRLGEAGRDVALLARRYGLPSDTPSHPTVLAPVEAVRELSELAESVLNDPFVGLHAAPSVPRGSYGVVEFAARNAPDLRGAVGLAVRYHQLLNELVEFSWEAREGGALAVEHRFPGDPLGVGRHGIEFSSAVVLRAMRDAVGKDAYVAPKRIWFAHRRPPDVSELAAFFGTQEIEFGRESNGMLFDAAAMDTPLPQADGALLPILDRHASMLLPASPPPTNVLGRIRQHVRVGLSEGASVEQTAAAMKMSVRTLQRRLGELGTTFQVVLDGVRAEMARQYVEDPRLSLGEVAFLLGYSDARAFLRAFKRWTDESPQQYRKRVLGARSSRRPDP
ncbi:MAG: AraC family transcriptional regulator [Polyangiaceae bacterium]|nr:AraC family transcriptional regulator [Polyangiaceae bacterium]